MVPHSRAELGRYVNWRVAWCSGCDKCFQQTTGLGDYFEGKMWFALTNLFVFQQPSLSTYTNFPFKQNAKALFEVIPFKLSDIGEGIREVVIKEWYVKVGDSVRQFDPICEVQSDKATVTITSRYDGTVRALHFELQDTCAVGQALVDIELAGDASDKPASSVTPSTETLSEPAAGSPQPPDKDTEDFGKVLATPSVRRLAMENKIKLSDVVGTGKGGRILKEDVLNFMSGTSAPSPAERREPPVQPVTPVVRPRAVSAGEDKVVGLTDINGYLFTRDKRSNEVPPCPRGNRAQ
ncbi:hypothetical protein AHF37_07874 [Paragonimus kellicotti]|nr:hypothetical protein AHF37_07874 [Paragonimus kellicotti]